SGTPRWEISFKPHAHLLARGNDPLRMLRELQAMGRVTTRVELDSLPALDELDAQSCYLSWTIELEGAQSEAQIRDVFDWAEGDCDLAIRRVDEPTVVDAVRQPEAPVEAVADAPAEVAHAPIAAAGSTVSAAQEADASSSAATAAAPVVQAPQPTIKDAAPAK